jgi:hypothetical protein
MRDDLPEEVQEALELLQIFENSNDHEEKAESIVDAYEILNEFLAEHPTSKHAEFTKNIKLTYARKFIQIIEQFGFTEIDILMHYAVAHFKLQKDFEQAYEKWPHLKESYVDFNEIFKKEFKEVILKQKEI